jgi:transcription elongation factor SPT6
LALFQFVGGLGPRKGAALLKTLRQMQSSQRLENRQQLVTLCHMGPKVLINCAGFIKIDTTRLGDSEVRFRHYYCFIFYSSCDLLPFGTQTI